MQLATGAAIASVTEQMHYETLGVFGLVLGRVTPLFTVTKRTAAHRMPAPRQSTR